MKTRPKADPSSNPLEIALASSCAVSGPTILHAMWTEDLRYLEGAGPVLIAVAWGVGLLLTSVAVAVAVKGWQQINPKA